MWLSLQISYLVCLLEFLSWERTMGPIYKTNCYWPANRKRRYLLTISSAGRRHRGEVGFGYRRRGVILGSTRAIFRRDHLEGAQDSRALRGTTSWFSLPADCVWLCNVTARERVRSKNSRENPLSSGDRATRHILLCVIDGRPSFFALFA